MSARPLGIGVALFALTIVVPALIVLRTGFDGLYGPDSYAYHDYADGPLRESLTRLHPPPPFFWPLGYPLLVVAAARVVARTSTAGQLVALVAAGLVPVLTFVLARALVRTERLPLSGAAAWAGLFMALTGQLWQSGMVVMSDTPALAAATASAIALVRYRETRQLRAVLLSGAALAAAVLIRWAYGLLVPPWVVCFLWISREAGDWRRGARHGAAGVAIFVCLLGPEIALGYLQPLDTGGPSFAGNTGIYRWSPLNAWRRRFDTVDGRLSYTLPNGLYYALAPASLAYFTPLAAPLVAVGLWSLARRRAAFTLLFLVGWAGIVWAFHAGADWQNIRFGLAYLPPLGILAGFGAAALLARPRRRVWATAVVVVAIVAMAGAATRLCLSFVTRMQARLEVVRWVEAQVPAGSAVLTFGFTQLFQHHARLAVRELFEETPAGLDALTRAPQPIYLLVDVRSLSTQWAERSPGVNFRWLRDGPGIVEIGARADATLFRVRRRVPDHMRSPDAATGQRN